MSFLGSGSEIRANFHWGQAPEIGPADPYLMSRSCGRTEDEVFEEQLPWWPLAP